MAARKKSKAKKPTETMRQKQMRLRREAAAAKAKAAAKPKSGSTMVNRNKPTMRKLAAKAAQSRKRASGRPLVRKPELDKAKKPSIKKGASALRGRVDAPKNLANMTSKLKAARAARGVRGALGKAGRALVPLGMATEVMSMRNRSKRDAERNKKLNRRPFEELRADNYKPNPNRRGQGSRPRKPAAKPKADPKAVARLTQPGGLFYRGPKPGSKPKPKPAAKPAAKPASKPKPKPAAKPAAKKPTPKKVTKKVSGVGPVKSGRSYSVQLKGSVMRQQAADLRKMREASKKRQAADKAKLKKSQSKKKKR